MPRGLGATISATEALEVGPYRVICTLGEGGHGVVYHARHQRSGDEVALKMVRVGDPSLIAAIRREIFALRSLEHPCVARIVDDGVAHGHPWYAMEFLGGDTMADYISRNFDRRAQSGVSLTVKASASAPTLVRAPGLADTEPPPPLPAPHLGAVVGLDDTIAILRALCAPLAFVHGAGLVHRDLKPDNVIISSSGAPVLVDFGLALRVAGTEPGRDVLDVSGRGLGTPAYMAPEQIRGEIIDARADLYALGCMLYECLTGSVPFDGTPGHVLRMHLSQRPTPPSRFVAGVPERLEVLVLRLLEKDPRDRLGFAIDVESVLAEIGGRPIAVAAAPAPRPYLYRPRLVGRRVAIEGLAEDLPGMRDPLRIVLVGGSSGVGKTRLAMELSSCAARRGIAVVAGQCLEVGGPPLHALRPLLLAIADGCRALSPKQAAQILGERGPILAAYEPTFRGLGGQGDLPAAAELPAEAARDRLLDALASTLIAFGHWQPILVVLDDLQWADEITLALLEHLAERGGVDITIVGTYRREEKTLPLGALLASGDVRDVSLEPLDREAVAQMVGDMLALTEPPSALIDFLLAESEGNPFFISEYLRTAVDEGVIRRCANGRWAMTRAEQSIASLRSTLPTPEGLRGLVRRRLGLLDDDARQLAEVAAVMGRQLDAAVLAAATDLEKPRSRRALELLRVRQVLEEADNGRLRFVHDKLREIIYADIAPSRLASVHGAVADAIEAHAGDRSAHYPILAHHHRRAGRTDRALAYFEKAGEQALASAAYGEARAHFSQAIAIAGEVHPWRRAGWERRLGLACYNAGSLDEAGSCLRRSLEGLGVQSAAGPVAAGVLSSLRALADQLRRALPRRPAPPLAAGEQTRYREAALAAERLSQVHYFKSERNLAFATALECLRHAERLGPSPELARAYATVSVALSYVPVPPLIEHYGARAQIIAAEAGDRHAVGWVAFMRGLTALRAARHRDAARFLTEGLAVATHNGDVRSGQEIQMLLAQNHSMAGRRQTALELARRTLEWAETTRNHQAELWARGAIAKNLTDLGRAAEAVAAYRDNRALAGASDDDSSQMAECYVALAHLELGTWGEARAVCDRLLDAGRRPSTWHACLGWLAAAETYLRLAERAPSDPDLARRTAQAIRLLGQSSRVFRSFAPPAQIFVGLSAWRAGRALTAERAWRRALDLATRLELPAEQARAHYELGRHAPLDAPRRRAHLAQAIALFDQVGATTFRARAEALAAAGTISLA